MNLLGKRTNVKWFVFLSTSWCEYYSVVRYTIVSRSRRISSRQGKGLVAKNMDQWEKKKRQMVCFLVEKSFFKEETSFIFSIVLVLEVPGLLR